VQFPQQLEVLIDHPRGSFVKRREDGGVDFVSPLPSPFNYGSVPGTRAADGDREDAIVLGARVAAGTRVKLPVLGRVRFIDAGHEDAKWVCGRSLGRADRLQLELFFRVYARAKRVLNAARRLPEPTEYRGLELPPGQR
jgi:inorganic pyrophosphatase